MLAHNTDIASMYNHPPYGGIKLNEMIFKELKYGFKYGDATIERHISDEKKGWVVLGLETSKRKLQIYVTKTGKVRIYDEDGKEWLPSNGG